MRRLLIPLTTLLSALIGSRVHALEGRVFTCYESNTVSWQMTQPQAHADAGLWPTWADCEAWRNGEPPADYVWSYGQTTPTTTTLPATTTTTELATTTTEMATTTTELATTTTIEATTTATTTTTLPPTTTTTLAPETTTTLEATTTTVAETTTTTTTTPPTDKRIQQPAAVIGAQLAPGVTSEQAQTVLVISAVSMAFTPTRKRK